MKACPRCGNARPCIAHPDYIDRRKNANDRGYTYRWKLYSRAFLVAHPFCAIRGERCTIVATRTDHVIPHRGDMALFWDETNHQPACETCHNRKSQSERVN